MPQISAVPQITNYRDKIDGLEVFWRGAPALAAAEMTPETGAEPAPILYLHGVPTNSNDWLSFVGRSGGLAPDLPGFGRSDKPNTFDYTIEGYADFIERFLDHLGIERVSLVVHDWGSVGLAFAQRHPERIERLVIINAVTFLPGYRWHRIARMWRVPVLGELVMGTTNRRSLRLTSREGNVTPGPMPESWLSSVLDHFDPGTQRAILRLYRTSPAEKLVTAGAKLATLTMPALVVWGERDPYIATSFGEQYAQVLPNAELLKLPDAGHWPWLDRPEVIDRVVEFLAVA